MKPTVPSSSWAVKCWKAAGPPVGARLPVCGDVPIACRSRPPAPPPGDRCPPLPPPEGPEWPGGRVSTVTFGVLNRNVPASPYTL
ncbi:hypothetical protein SGLAM104S_03249 [Streptomyces glaucescens]